MLEDDGLPQILDDRAIAQILEFDDDTRMPWERLERGESTRAYAAFIAYRDMGITRTVAALQQRLGGSLETYRSLSSRNGWVRRAEAYDDWLERKERQLVERGRMEARRRQINLGQQLQNKALEGLAAMNPYTASARDLAMMADVGVKLERSARGEVDTKRLEITGQGGGPVETVQSLSSSDRHELLAAIQSQISDRMGQLPGPRIIEGELAEEE